MGDVVFVLATLVFFGVCVLYVSWCDRIVGDDDFGAEPVADGARADVERTEVAA